MKETFDLYAIERELRQEGYSYVVGVDEAGRGPLAGPVFAAAVVLPEETNLPGLNDSKKLTAKKRDWLYDAIREQALAYGIAHADEKTIDEINILNAVYQAMNEAASQIPLSPRLLLIDGNRNKGIVGESRCVIKGDAKCACIAAASILAKVSRDRYMEKLAESYPQYGFERHKGYGTALHYEKLREFGPAPIHRLSFLKNLKDKH
ncbi:MAG: ribonuclease HII [Oscillospiraceae bacterium]|nr:ribonuclease HII [Oscillospiraceae bacterium]